MVYSGHIAFYGIHLNNYKELWSFIQGIVGLKAHYVLLAHNFQEDNIFHAIPYEIIRMILNYCVVQEPKADEWLGDEFDEFMQTNVCELDIRHQPCCYNDGGFFIGFVLGDTYFAYRDSIDEYATFESYLKKYYKQLRKIKKEHKKLQSRIDEFDIYASKLGHVGLYLTWANDCENCS